MTRWQRVTKARPCPICETGDWCIVSPDGAAAICPRVQSTRYIDGSGYLHTLRVTREWQRSTMLYYKDPEAMPEHHGILAQMMNRYAAIGDDQLWPHAHELGLRVDALRRLGAGWSQSQRALAFPQSRIGGQLIGIRFRDSAGRKWAARGSKGGLFIPEDLDPTRTIVVVEGATDTAACLAIGLNAVGLHGSCMSWRIVAEVAAAKSVLFILDNDASDNPKKDKVASGHVVRLAMNVALYAKQVRAFVCPAKDMRRWILDDGATRDDVVGLAVKAAVIEPESKPSLDDIDDLLDHLYGVPVLTGPARAIINDALVVEPEKRPVLVKDPRVGFDGDVDDLEIEFDSDARFVDDEYCPQAV